MTWIERGGLHFCRIQCIEPAHGVCESGEPLGLARDRRCGRAHAIGFCNVPDDLGLSTDHGERRPQVVREGGVHLAAVLGGAPELALGALELGAHGLELLAEPPELVRALGLHVKVQVARRDAPCRVVHDGDGPGEPRPVEAPARHHEARHEDQRHRGDGRPREGAVGLRVAGVGEVVAHVGDHELLPS